MNSACKEQFEQIMLPHLNAVYNLARWLTHSEHDASDVVQESYLRAFRFSDSYRQGNPKAWLADGSGPISRLVTADRRCSGRRKLAASDLELIVYIFSRTVQNLDK